MLWKRHLRRESRVQVGEDLEINAGLPHTKISMLNTMVLGIVYLREDIE